MCTLSVMPSEDHSAIRVVMNRDERRLRMAATPPARFEREGVSALWPVDLQAGGTWIAVNDAGLVLALLNVNHPARPRGRAVVTRGRVIPELVASRTLEEVACRLAARDYQDVDPFRLVAVSPEGVLTLSPGAPAQRGGYVWSTSSLGDDSVETPRRDLFDHLLATNADAWVAQDRFHQHAWPDRRHLSVLMSRPDACTVSRTTVVVTAGRVEMHYAAIIDGWPAGVTLAQRLDTTRTVLAA